MRDGTLRTNAPPTAVDKMLRDSLPVLNGIVADSGNILDVLQVRELDEPGVQYERQTQKARAIRGMAIEIQSSMRKLAKALRDEERIYSEAEKPE
jgi:hypothetical protein